MSSKKPKTPFHFSLTLSAYLDYATLPLIFYFLPPIIQSILITFSLITLPFYFFSLLHITFHLSCPFLFYGVPFSSMIGPEQQFYFHRVSRFIFLEYRTFYPLFFIFFIFVSFSLFINILIKEIISFG